MVGSPGLSGSSVFTHPLLKSMKKNRPRHAAGQALAAGLNAAPMMLAAL